MQGLVQAQADLCPGPPISVKQPLKAKSGSLQKEGLFKLKLPHVEIDGCSMHSAVQLVPD